MKIVKIAATALLSTLIALACGPVESQLQTEPGIAQQQTMENPTVPGMWGTTSTSDPTSIQWPPHWYGVRDLRAQWWKILADSPDTWQFENHAKGEPPGNTYFLWRYHKPVPSGTKILIEGDFPHARMMNFQVCAPWSPELPSIGDGTGIPEIALLDEDIVPDPGHTNPFLPGADRNASKRHYHITFELRDGNPVALNGAAAIPPYRAPGNLRYGCTQSGKNGDRGPFIWMRIFLPDHYEPYGQVATPVIRIQFPGQQPQLAPITREVELNMTQVPQRYSIRENPAIEEGRSRKEQESLDALKQWARASLAQAGKPGDFVPKVAQVFTHSDGTLKLIKSFGTPLFIGWLRNADDPDHCRTTLLQAYRHLYGMSPKLPPPANDEHTSGHNVHITYLYSAATLKPGRVLVFRGKAPKTPRTLAGNPIMESSEQLRYWGITLQTGSPIKLIPVIDIIDENIVIDAQGNYTIAIGAESDRPANAYPENGITWFPWPIGDSLAVNVRVMSTSTQTWQHAPQRITWEDSDYCDLNKFPYAVKHRMGDYHFEGRYLLKEQVERWTQAGSPPYQLPAQW
ncbi:hypothetical protein QPK87_22305 [Kamptonema cortianum]|uniref:Lipoprotein n=1 Tax=Geitlerinema calcuttense NRMC-F 0142 TaxID=2922238 RepID=A0ABT7LXW7_9CYAN|nr:hypothetical protein [Geitlerinema calcuttense]MDK3159283.1 hypothetical protein [Kamptonema cortianum]MDL5056833.1 hypothetical protein [Geitlerinema calcuttense NRMC-F 0142]